MHSIDVNMLQSCITKTKKEGNKLDIRINLIGKYQKVKTDMKVKVKSSLEFFLHFP